MSQAQDAPVDADLGCRDVKIAEISVMLNLAIVPP